MSRAGGSRLLLVVVVAFVVCTMVLLFLKRDSHLAALEQQRLDSRRGAASRFLGFDSSDKDNQFLAWHEADSRRFTLLLRCSDAIRCQGLVQFYSSCPSLASLIVCWSGSEESMPGPEVLGNSVTVVHSPHFLANAPRIASEGVLLADDTAQVSIESLEFAFSLWKQFPMTVTKFSLLVRRVQLTDDSQPIYAAACDGPVIPLMFMDARYMQALDEGVPATLKAFVHSNDQCAALALEMFIGHYTKLPAVLAKAEVNMLVQQGDSTAHLECEVRNQCITDLTEYFGYMPLQFSNFRAEAITPG